MRHKVKVKPARIGGPRSDVALQQFWRFMAQGDAAAAMSSPASGAKGCSGLDALNRPAEAGTLRPALRASPVLHTWPGIPKFRESPLPRPRRSRPRGGSRPVAIPQRATEPAPAPPGGADARDIGLAGQGS